MSERCKSLEEELTETKVLYRKEFHQRKQLHNEVCVCVCACVCVCVCACVLLCVCVCVHVQESMHTLHLECLHTCLHMCDV